MATVAASLWNSRGVLAPYLSTEEGRDRSPYTLQLLDIINNFCGTHSRCQIMRRFLSYRSALHAVGVDDGFQWIDGSFVEDVETVRGRPPGDIDVTTFIRKSPANIPSASLVLFDNAHAKANYSTDAYFFELENVDVDTVIRNATYWYSMWSHRRIDKIWKGFVSVDLSSTDDAAALARLIEIEAALP